MPFAKGNQLGQANRGRKKEPSKTLWLLQALTAEGVDLRHVLARNILKADKGDRQALEVAHLLTKLLPYVANAPRHDGGVAHIETLVINRIERASGSSTEHLPDGQAHIERPAPKPLAGPVVDVEPVTLPDGHPPLTSA